MSEDRMESLEVQNRVLKKALTTLAEGAGKLHAKTEWQPIETAPKDYTNILVWNDGGAHRDGWVSIAYWNDDGWISPFGGEYDPTHWQPLPEPPS